MIRKTGNPLDEQETIINIDPAQISKTATVYSTIPADINRMWKLHEKYPEECKVIHDDKYGTEFAVPRNWVKVRRPRQMSEEQRIAATEHLARIRPDNSDDDE